MKTWDEIMNQDTWPNWKRQAFAETAMHHSEQMHRYNNRPAPMSLTEVPFPMSTTEFLCNWYPRLDEDDPEVDALVVEASANPDGILEWINRT